jgi:hypothetical protein
MTAILVADHRAIFRLARALANEIEMKIRAGSPG